MALARKIGKAFVRKEMNVVIRIWPPTTLVGYNVYLVRKRTGHLYADDFKIQDEHCLVTDLT